MAEIRKHNPKVRDQIDAAILDALGEDVRHTAPGEEPKPVTRPTAAAPKATSTFAVGLGGTGWTAIDPRAVAKPTAKPAPSDEDDEDLDDDEL